MWIVALLFGAPWLFSVTLAVLLAFVHLAQTLLHWSRSVGSAPGVRATAAAPPGTG